MPLATPAAMPLAMPIDPSVRSNWLIVPVSRRWREGGVLIWLPVSASAVDARPGRQSGVGDGVGAQLVGGDRAALDVIAADRAVSNDFAADLATFSSVITPLPVSRYRQVC